MKCIGLVIIIVGLVGCSGTDSIPVTSAPVDEQLPALAEVWQPQPGTSWQWQLSGEIDSSIDVTMYDVDLFDTPQATIDALQADGRIVICYFSAGTFEEWRPDAKAFPQEVIGRRLEDWPGERWLDVRQRDVLKPIMAARLDLAASKNCDGVEPDNVTAYQNASGISLTYDDQLAYNIWLANEAHARTLSVGLKNNLDQIPALVPYFDWALNEECFYYEECEALLPFIQANKAVFGVEYELDTTDFCAEANTLNLDFMQKRWDLDAWRIPCR